MPRVLFIDDEPLVLHAYTRALQRTGMIVQPVADSRAVPELLAQGGFEAVFCDISMPGLDGIEVLRAVLASDPDLPVVLMSGGSELIDADQALEQGAIRYLMKPIDLDVLKRVAAEALALRRLALLERQTSGMCERGAGMGPVEPIVSISRGLAIGHVLARGVRELPPEGELLVACVEPDELEHDSRLPRRDAYLALDERALVGRPGSTRLRERLEDLEALGHKPAIDGLGATAGGLAALAAVAPQLMRLHPSLVRGLDVEPERQTLVREMIAACVKLGALVVAPGVRTRGERDAIAAAGCDLVQAEGGYDLS